jgi:hypothetical protein
MTDSERLTSHLKILNCFNPQLASLIQALPLTAFSPSFLFEKENKELFDRLIVSDPEVLYIYGIGSGYFYQVAKSWIQENKFRYLVFLDDDLKAIQQFLQLPQATEVLNDPCVDIYYVQNPPFDRMMIRQIATNYMLRKMSLGTLPSIEGEKKEQWFDLKEALAYETAEQSLQDNELANYGLSFYSNFYHNLLELPNAYLTNHLKDSFKNVPAIICGAGHSLEAQLPLLNELRQHALLFAPGSALNILSYAGLRPHFGVAIDPTPTSFHRQVMHRAFEIPMFYRNRLYYETLTAIHGPRLFLSGTTFYELSNWFEKELELESLHFEEGYSVVHQTVEIARFLGCNPIIFTGLDLSQKDHHYAQGIERHPLFPVIENKTHLGQPIQVHNLKGENVWSYWPWIAEAQWLEIYQFEYPELNLINATEEGIGLFSILNQSLDELKTTFLKEKINLDTSIHQSIQSAGKVPVNLPVIIEKIKQFQESLKKCQQFILDKERESAFEKEIGYQFVLKQFESFFKQFATKDRQKIQRMVNEKEQAAWTMTLNNELEMFLLQTVILHLQAIENALNSIPESLPKIIEKRQSLMKQASYYASGALYSEYLENGTELFYYESGQLKSEIPYLDHQLSGCVRLYYPNGQLKRELFFLQGKRGIERSWYENGQLFTEVNPGQSARSWFKNGNLAQEVKA